MGPRTGVWGTGRGAPGCRQRRKCGISERSSHSQRSNAHARTTRQRSRPVTTGICAHWGPLTLHAVLPTKQHRRPARSVGAEIPQALRARVRMSQPNAHADTHARAHVSTHITRATSRAGKRKLERGRGSSPRSSTPVWCAAPRLFSLTAMAAERNEGEGEGKRRGTGNGTQRGCGHGLRTNRRSPTICSARSAASPANNRRCYRSRRQGRWRADETSAWQHLTRSDGNQGECSKTHLRGRCTAAQCSRRTPSLCTCTPTTARACRRPNVVKIGWW